MDPIQLIGSFVAIVLLAVVARWLFPAPKALTANMVTEDFARYAPDSTLQAPILSKNGTAAIVPLSGTSEFGLVTLLGDQPVCRLVGSADHPSLAISGETVTLKTHDFTQPVARLILDAADQSKLEQLVADLNKGLKHAA